MVALVDFFEGVEGLGKPGSTIHGFSNVCALDTINTLMGTRQTDRQVDTDALTGLHARVLLAAVRTEISVHTFAKLDTTFWKTIISNSYGKECNPDDVAVLVMGLVAARRNYITENPTATASNMICTQIDMLLYELYSLETGDAIDIIAPERFFKQFATREVDDYIFNPAKANLSRAEPDCEVAIPARIREAAQEEIMAMGENRVRRADEKLKGRLSLQKPAQ